MRRYLVFLSLILSMIYSEGLYANCTISAKTDNNSVLVGDSIILTITLKYKDGEYCRLTDDINLPKFKILKKDIKTEKSGEQIMDTYTIHLTPLELGEVSISPINVQTSIDGGYSDDEAALSTPEIKITVNGIIKNKEEAKLKDILPPEKVFERTYILLYIIGGLILLAVFIYLIIRYLKKRRGKVINQKAEQNITSQLPPYDEAILSLKLLEEERLISKNMFKELYLRLTEILKRFIERFYGFNALEMTTDELLFYLMDHPQPNLDLNDIRNFLGLADLVKFAKYEVDAELAYRDFNFVKNIIERAARPISMNINSSEKEVR